MSVLPFNPTTPGEAMLASYLQADPKRLPVVQTIFELLDPDGAVGDRARYYVVRCGFRRAVLRATLVALGFKLPSWTKELRSVQRANVRFVRRYEREVLGLAT